jgi:putative Mg2+ transporter-C (MgtC) family protein
MMECVMDDLTVLIRLVLSVVLGAVIGMEREKRGSSAGLRTHVLVSMGACLFTVASMMVFAEHATTDPTRIASTIVTGIGFLGAGTIIRDQANHVRGLTTAASIWVASAIGLSVGFGFYVAASVTAVLSFVVLKVLRDVEMRFMEHDERGNGHNTR